MAEIVTVPVRQPLFYEGDHRGGPNGRRISRREVRESVGFAFYRDGGSVTDHVTGTGLSRASYFGLFFSLSRPPFLSLTSPVSW